MNAVINNCKLSTICQCQEKGDIVESISKMYNLTIPEYSYEEEDDYFDQFYLVGPEEQTNYYGAYEHGYALAQCTECNKSFDYRNFEGDCVYMKGMDSPLCRKCRQKYLPVEQCVICKITFQYELHQRDCVYELGAPTCWACCDEVKQIIRNKKYCQDKLD